MLLGSSAWEINFQSPRGFFVVCCACGTNNQIDLRPELNNEVEGEFYTRPYALYAIIECGECGQIVHVLPDGISMTVKESDRYEPQQQV